MSTSPDSEAHDDPHQYSDTKPDLESEYNLKARRSPMFRASKKNHRKWCKMFEPMEQLPLTLRFDRENFKKPWYSSPSYRVCFSFGITRQQLVDYAHRVKLLKLDSPDWKKSAAAYNVALYLSVIAEAELDSRLIWHTRNRYCVSLYNNYTQYSKQLVEEDEKDVLDIIREELNIPDVAPMWYFQVDEDD